MLTYRLSPGVQQTTASNVIQYAQLHAGTVYIELCNQLDNNSSYNAITGNIATA